MTTPPLPPLHEVVAALARAGIVCALGGSGLLAARGLVEQVNDWDLTTDASLEEVERALTGRAIERAGPSGVHADHKAMLASARTEVIVRFAFTVAEGVVRIPTVVTGRWQGVPLGSPEGWAVAYVLLGRPARADLWFAYLADHGVDEVTRARLLAEPLPDRLASRLAALPRASL